MRRKGEEKSRRREKVEQRAGREEENLREERK